MRNLNEANPPLDPLNWDVDLNSLSGEFGAHKKGGEMRARPKNIKKRTYLLDVLLLSMFMMIP